MFAVKEFTIDEEFIGATFFFDNKEAIELAKKIKNTNKNVIAYVTEIDYDEEGYLWELVVYKPNVRKDERRKTNNA